MEATWSHIALPPVAVSTGCPICTPSSVTIAGNIVAVAGKSFTLVPTTQCGVQDELASRALLELEAKSTSTSHCGG
jgi:hypothetical protein